MNQRWKPSSTVAAIIEQKGRFLLVEEHSPEGVRLNNPAGHLDPGESLIEACVRETLEETAYEFTPESIIGIYLSRFSRKGTKDIALEDISYLRFAFTGTLGQLLSNRSLDHGIIRTMWLTPDEIRNSKQLHRSPLVLQCVEDYLIGQRFDLSVLKTLKSIYVPMES